MLTLLFYKIKYLKKTFNPINTNIIYLFATNQKKQQTKNQITTLNKFQAQTRTTTENIYQ
ncbi:hypothetical protein RCH33_2469 [Flavobacterium daejeonense]|nr:hypothetical protein RCH33_2469 [Flavobacterium daejeonense]